MFTVMEKKVAEKNNFHNKKKSTYQEIFLNKL